MLDENIGSYREDMDFALRARKSGIQVKYTSKAVVHHRHRHSITSVWKTSFHRRKNSVGFLKKYGVSNRFNRTPIAKTVATFATLAFLLFTFSISVFLFASTALVVYLLLLGRFLSRTRGSASIELMLYPFIYATAAVTGSLGTVCAFFALLRARL